MSKQVKFRFSKIETLQFATIDEAFDQEKEFHTETRLEFSLNPERKEVSVLPLVKYLQGDSPFIQIKTENIFSISTDSWNKMLQTNSIVLPMGFLQHISFLSVGALRGVLHSKTEKTKFCNYILPTVNLNEIITEDVSFELNEVMEK